MGSSGALSSLQFRAILEEKLAAAVKDKALANTKPCRAFTKLLLEFPALQRGFAAARRAFAELDTSNSGSIGLSQLSDAAGRLGYHVDETLIKATFATSDLDGTQGLHAEEFIVALCILHLLKAPKDAEQLSPEVLAAFDTAEAAFLSFDSSRRGFIDRAELESAMREGYTERLPRMESPASAMQRAPSYVERRFDELDIDRSGEVTLAEFLFVLESWVQDADEGNGAAAAQGGD